MTLSLSIRAGSTGRRGSISSAAQTDRLHVVERFTRPDFGRLIIDVTIDDPGAYTRPWTVRQEVFLRPDWEPLEFICGENNRDIERLPGGHLVVPNVEAAAALGIAVR